MNDGSIAAPINLAQPRLGAEVIEASDDFFAPKERLIDPADPVFIPDKYDEHGKWMDGWESRRRRVPGHDHCVVRLGVAGVIDEVDIDTRHFDGNHPPAASLEACRIVGTPDDRTTWRELLPRTPIAGDSHNRFAVCDRGVWTHVRLHIYPDGGVARLRVYGRVHRDWRGVEPDTPIDLAALANGGRAIACNDMRFGALENLIAPGRGRDMGDGWETRRRREPGHDWAIVALAHRGRVCRVEVDTAHFKGNYPERCSIEGADIGDGCADERVAEWPHWRVLLPEQPLAMDRVHNFESEIADLGPITHARLNIYPDGGVSRLRLYGRIVAPAEA